MEGESSLFASHVSLTDTVSPHYFVCFGKGTYVASRTNLFDNLPPFTGGDCYIDLTASPGDHRKSRQYGNDSERVSNGETIEDRIRELLHFPMH